MKQTWDSDPVQRIVAILTVLVAVVFVGSLVTAIALMALNLTKNIDQVSIQQESKMVAKCHSLGGKVQYDSRMNFTGCLVEKKG